MRNGPGQVSVTRFLPNCRPSSQSLMNRADRVAREHLGEKVVWQMVQQYAAEVGVSGIAPHNLRRTYAKLCRAAGGELEQIQLLLGHASVQTTERYRNQAGLVHAPNDCIKIEAGGRSEEHTSELQSLRHLVC